MSKTSSTPTVLQGGARRDPWKRNRVRLESPEGGEVVEGELKIPRHLAYAKPDTNEAHMRDVFIRQYLRPWMEWRHRRDSLVPIPGTMTQSEPYEIPKGMRVEMPFAANFNDTGEQEEMVAIRFIYRARRERPQYMPYDDFDHAKRWADIAGVDFDSGEAKATENVVSEGKDEIVATGETNALKVAEERRKKYGFKREDFLIGNLEDPL